MYLDAAITRLRVATDGVEGRGEEVEPGPALIRLLGIIEHVESILDRNLSPETIDWAIQHLQHTLHGAAAEIDASQVTAGTPRPSGRSGLKLVS